jgi:hypothetical protein
MSLLTAIQERNQEPPKPPRRYTFGERIEELTTDPAGHIVPTGDELQWWDEAHGENAWGEEVDQ